MKNYYKDLEEAIERFSTDDESREFLLDVIRKSDVEIFDIFSREKIKEDLKGEDVFDYFDESDLMEAVVNRYRIDDLYPSEDIKDFLISLIDEEF